ILSSRGMPDDLSVRWNQRASVALAFASVFAAAAGRPLIALLPALAVAAVNHRFYGFLIARRGLWFAVRALPVHFLYFLYSGVAFGLGLAGHLVASFRGTPVPAIKSSVEWSIPTILRPYSSWAL